MAELEPRQCKQCDKIFGPAPHQVGRPGRWVHTDYCSVPCANRAKAYGMRTEVVDITCATCQEVFQTNRAYRKFCSRSCSSAFARTRVKIETGPRTCEGCNAVFERRPKERPNAFQRRRFCGPTCSARYASSKRDYTVGVTTKKKVVEMVKVEEPVSFEPVLVWRPASLGGSYWREPASQLGA